VVTDLRDLGVPSDKARAWAGKVVRRSGEVAQWREASRQFRVAQLPDPHRATTPRSCAATEVDQLAFEWKRVA
jgi:hypothetical protein